MDLDDILEHSKHTYNLVASSYQESFADELSKKQFDRELLDKISLFLQKNSGLILDVGCGSAGHVGRYLYEKGLNVIGIDLSSECIKLAQIMNPGMHFKVMNMLHLHFDNSSIQAIFAFYSIIHIPKVEINNLYREFYRVLQQNGLLVLAVHEGDVEQVIDEMLGYKTTLFVNFFTEPELITKLNNSNFTIEYSYTRDPYEFEHQTRRIYIIAKAIKT